MQPLSYVPARTFADAAVDLREPEGGQEGLEAVSHEDRIGADRTFDDQKHAYVLTFPWNYPEIISTYEGKYPGAAAGW